MDSLYRSLLKPDNGRFRQLIGNDFGLPATPVHKLMATRDVRVLNNRNRRFEYIITGHPSFLRDVTIDYIPNRGRGVKAVFEIEVGELVVSAEPFAAVVEDTRDPYCLTCHKTFVRMTICDACNMAFFCSRKCELGNTTHQYECGTIFHNIFNVDAKCAIQMVFEAMSIFETVDELREFVLTATRGQRFPADSYDQQTRFDTILKLFTLNYHKQAKMRTRDQRLVKIAFQYIREFPRVTTYFAQEIDFLQNLIAHFISVLVGNSFGTHLDSGGTPSRRLMYDSFSLLNHSCIPNLMPFVDGKNMICYACRPIAAQDELTISYIDVENLIKNRKHRRTLLTDRFNFTCECERCQININVNAAQKNKASAMSFVELVATLGEETNTVNQIVEKIPYIYAFREIIDQYNRRY